jgi:hypothetical protein
MFDFLNDPFSVVELSEGDLVFLVSDGVHDNLDPQTLGKKPNDCGLFSNAEFAFLVYQANINDFRASL